ncbi:hypothetical protein JK176_11735 [Gluconobacter sp. Dm-73]|uniref:hypothetical protein n=1 Tax=Gluconobacter sp. Dm-73 TaxID=2799802 RepID=UPI001B8D3618|nr:hypothetical protein [Gluconobacter sp. Dm-73]MBS1075556.1 hypothetical protein [Gluconobacter sp. Dm-73]
MQEKIDSVSKDYRKKDRQPIDIWKSYLLRYFSSANQVQHPVSNNIKISLHGYSDYDMRTILSRKSSKDRSGVPVVWAEGDSEPSAIVYPPAQGEAGIVHEVLSGCSASSLELPVCSVM